PIIVDESYPSPESAAFHELGYEGALVARGISPQEPFPMSAYRKSTQPLNHGYATVRTCSDGVFSYAAPTFASQPGSAPATSPGYLNSSQLTPMTFPPTHTSSGFDEQSGPYLNVGATPDPEVTSYSPSRGSAGTKVYVSITSLYELMTSSTPVFYLTFGNRKCPATLSKINQQGGVCQYTVAGEVPEQATTGAPSQEMIHLLMETGDGDVMAKIKVGPFSHVQEQISNPASQDNPRKRKMSDASQDMKSPIKRTTPHILRPKQEYGPAYAYSTADGSSSYSPFMPALPFNNITPQYSRAMTAYSPHPPFGYATASHQSSPTIKAEFQQAGAWRTAYHPGQSMRNNHNLPLAVSRPDLSSLAAPASSATTPTLIRTSTLQQTPVTHPSQVFNAYAMYPNKAQLELSGDVQTMAQNWSSDEWESKRRLVIFERTQVGSTIKTTFRPATPDERPPQHICISCIYWEEKRECFVTSVDTIYLLEALIGIRFPVEEKNRVRRNLEGFHPLTVSKGRPESEQFFKVIMAFPKPKPRNIEKDVKVFHWKDLVSALRKIFAKYSASPSSTLPPHPPLLTPASTTGYGVLGSSAGISYVGDHHGAISPGSISGPSTSTPYATNIPTRGVSPLSQKSLALAGPPDPRASLPLNPHESNRPWQGKQHHMQTAQQYPQQMGAPKTRNAYDMSSYMDHSPATAGSASTPQPVDALLNDPRHAADSAVQGGEEAGGENRLARSLSSQHQRPSHQMSLSRS
ncbi:hypothetical protein BJ875DRAFT_520212, partial [Amylocarpus encephaloides]